MKQIILTLVLTLAIHAQVHLRERETSASVPTTSWIEIKNRHLVRQKEDFSCGTASLATILRYYYGHKNATEKKILDAYFKLKGVSRDNLQKLIKEQTGLSFLDLGELATQWGYHPVGLAIDMAALGDVQMPIIVFLMTRNGGHFSVYKGMDARYVHLADPSFGNTRMRLSKFEKMFLDPKTKQGKILAVIPPGDPATNKAFMKLPKAARTAYRMIGISLGK